MKNTIATIILSLGALCAMNAHADVSISEVIVESAGDKNCYTTTYSNGNKTTECIISTTKPKASVKQVVRESAGTKTCYTTTFVDNTTVTECTGA